MVQIEGQGSSEGVGELNKALRPKESPLEKPSLAELADAFGLDEGDDRKTWPA